MTENNDDQEQLFPENIRKFGFWVSLIFSLAFILYYLAFTFQYVATSPKDLEFSNLLLFSAASS
jgi:TRAP-type C4-dicarboxylate transport system permease small subunit